jgi:hypothetical protein
MKSGKEQEHLVKSPLTDSINLEEDSLEEEEQKRNSYHLSYDHHKKVGPVSHITHEANLDKKGEKSQVSMH